MSGQRLRERGVLVAAEALRADRNGDDGARAQRQAAGDRRPFAETKEQLAGFYLVDAHDLNEAIQIASKIPPAREGSVEVRPVRELVP
jgi:hypothetical protein